MKGPSRASRQAGSWTRVRQNEGLTREAELDADRARGQEPGSQVGSHRRAILGHAAPRTVLEVWF
jgi:hypothetical protein